MCVQIVVLVNYLPYTDNFVQFSVTQKCKFTESAGYKRSEVLTVMLWKISDFLHMILCC